MATTSKGAVGRSVAPRGRRGSRPSNLPARGLRRALSLERWRQEGIDRGLRGGSRRWLVLGGLAWAWKLLRWAWAKESEVVYRGRLAPGQTLVIEHARKTRR